VRRYCDSVDDARVHYRRPSEPLAMGRHWEWIVQQALTDLSITHICFLTDRMVFIPSAVTALVGVAKRNPNHIIAYPNDHIDDLRTPVSLNQHDWTGRVVEARSVDFLRYMRTTSWSSALP